ncbi:MAG TPA: hypothetical protein VG929_07205 [Actinomycetota bacterium]|nr:hypothetical protein [Actinomycetota bacterium]
MTERPEDDIERDVDEQMRRAQEAGDADRLQTLEEVQETLEAELDDGGETHASGR